MAVLGAHNGHQQFSETLVVTVPGVPPVEVTFHAKFRPVFEFNHQSLLRRLRLKPKGIAAKIAVGRSVFLFGKKKPMPKTLQGIGLVECFSIRTGCCEFSHGDHPSFSTVCVSYRSGQEGTASVCSGGICKLSK